MNVYGCFECFDWWFVMFCSGKVALAWALYVIDITFPLLYHKHKCRCCFSLKCVYELDSMSQHELSKHICSWLFHHNLLLLSFINKLCRKCACSFFHITLSFCRFRSESKTTKLVKILSLNIWFHKGCKFINIQIGNITFHIQHVQKHLRNYL